MDHDKKMWIIGGTIIGAATLWFAWKQYEISKANATNASDPNQASLDSLLMQPLSSAPSQPQGYSGPSPDTGNAAFQNILNSILTPPTSPGTDTGASSSSASEGTSALNSVPGRNQLGGGVWGVRPVGPEPVVNSPFNTPSTTQPTLIVKSPNFINHPSPVTTVPSGLL